MVNTSAEAPAESWGNEEDVRNVRMNGVSIGVRAHTPRIRVLCGELCIYGVGGTAKACSRIDMGSIVAIVDFF